nr:hypothetical protein [uncultured Methanoregula sp.]
MSGTHEQTGKEGIPFRSVIEDELAIVRKSRMLFSAADRFGTLHGVILFSCILVNVLFLAIRRDYFVLFIAASFYLNMFYFISLLIPTNREFSTIRKGDLKKILAWLQDIGIATGTIRFSRLFLNAFFINSRALSLGIGMIFSIDIIFAIIAYVSLNISFASTVIVISQCAIIAMFYFLIWKIEPFSSAFVKNVEDVKTRLSDNKVPPILISALFMVAFFFAVILILATIILLPGMTVAAFLTNSGLEALGHLLALIIVLALSQYFIIRYIHGAGSRLMAQRLLDYKENTLQGLLEWDRTSPAVPANPYETTTLLLESKIYQVKQNTLLGAFPVYVVDLDFSVMTNSTMLTAIRGYIQEKKS